MNSKELQAVQTYLTSMLLEAVDAYDFDLVKNLAERLSSVDKDRREAWHKEKFGAYEENAEVLFIKTEPQEPVEIHIDDIPF